MEFRAKVIPSGNATAIEIPTKVMEAVGSESRPLIVVTINGHSWRSRVALMRGKVLVEVDLELDTEPRVVPEPPDLAEALNADPDARAAFERLAYGLKRKHVAAVEQSKTSGTRQRRIAKLVTTLRQGGSARRRWAAHRRPEILLIYG